MAKSHVSGPLWSAGGFYAGQDPTSLSSPTPGASPAWFVENSVDGISAAGSNQAGATLITGQTSRISTASAGQGVQLPLAQGGLELSIINDSSVAVQLYASALGTDFLNDVAGSTGIPLMPNSMVIASAANTGKWYITGIGTGFATSGVNIETASFQAAISAAGTTYLNATPVVNQINQVTVVGAGQGVVLPSAKPGLQIQVSNYQATNALLVYGAGGTDTIQTGGSAPAASLSLPAYKTANLWCAASGAWHGVVA